MAEQIVNLSRTALNDANEAIFGGLFIITSNFPGNTFVSFLLVSATGQHISSLINKVQEIKQRLENTNILIEKQSIETNRTYNEAAQMLSNVESVRLPNVVPGDLHSNAQEVSSEAAKLQNVKNKATKNEALLLEAEQTLREAFDQIQNAIVKQKVLSFSLPISILIIHMYSTLIVHTMKLKLLTLGRRLLLI
jgi:hypothetical protein